MIPHDFSNLLRRELASGKILDEAIAVLRAAGASQVECIVALQSVRRYTLEEAKRVVHESHAWADVRHRDEALWDELISGCEQEA